MRAVVLLAALAAFSTDASARTFVLRSTMTGAIAAPVVVPPLEPTTPDSPAGFSLSITGQTSVAAGTALDLRLVVAGASGSIVAYAYFGTLPLGASFNAASGSISGKALRAGTYQIRVSATDSTGAMVTAAVTLVVT